MSGGKPGWGQPASDRGKTALLAVTGNGCRTLARLRSAFPKADAYLPEKFRGTVPTGAADGDDHRVYHFSPPVRPVIADLFHRYDYLVLLIALGAAVRLIAPLLQSKTRDPAVVVADEAGRYAISLVSAHRGGANDLARKVGSAIRGIPVITTASEVQGTLAVDQLGREWGWTLEGEENLTQVSAASVNGEPVGLIQESGEKLDPDALPENWTCFSSCEQALQSGWKGSGWILITHRLLGSREESLREKGVLFRPRSLVLGVGCSRGAPAEEMEALIRQTLQENRLSLASIRCLASITLKRDEDGLRELAQRYQWPLCFYAPEELNRIPIPRPSDYVWAVTGAYAVSQPAALLNAGADRLLVEKEKSRNATLSVALADLGRLPGHV
ncbi:cobalt-precorrin 5A hydrolase [Paludifilum halophilum]|uniref:Cobalamin biosynthesis protein CbiG n=1 Tax=Paludifilum halophilum TaxID=1642702 RepID=A0A235B952_9BACL|nr:cobalamin biosynthesis protein [Paludifilum halophilum]OYD08806.1 hypothetical protein CHM34_03145 [Paludifilum halophilum]